jgi:hypothetical protein
MNREELSEAIHDLADSPHMRQHVLEHALAYLDLLQLAALFDEVADHHSLLHPVGRRNAGGGSVVPADACLEGALCTNPRCRRHWGNPRTV